MSSRDQAEERLRAHVTSVKEDLLTGVSYMIPFVTIGGIFLALSFLLVELPFHPDSAEMQVSEWQTGTPGWFLNQIGGLGLEIMIPILGAYIAWSIADKPGLAPGFIMAYAIQQPEIIAAAGDLIGYGTEESASAGFLGAIVAGLLVGYVARWMKNWTVPDYIKPMMPILVIPVGATLLLFPVLVLGLGVPIAIVDQELTSFLEGLQGAQALVLGLILGGMMAFDMGGPVNKVAYLFGFSLIAQGITEPMAAVMIAGMVPPLGLAVSNFVAPQKYPAEMYENGKAAVPLGLSFITEGAIPYAASDPLRVIPSIMVGSATAAAASMWLGVTMPAPHGGVFVVILSNSPLLFLACLALGTIVTAAIVTAVKPDAEVESVDEEVVGSTADAGK